MLPDATWFPDRWEPTRRGVQALAQRLLTYAGLGSYIADVTLEEDASDQGRLLPRTAVDFAGLEGNVAFFTVTALGRADDAALALAHEVARAALLARATVGETYRDGPGSGPLEPRDDAAERADASILGLTLGLGVLGVRGSFRFHQAGSIAVTEWRRVVYGGLAPEEAVYLLAVQLCVRGAAADALDAILGLLDARRTEVEAELRALDAEALIVALGLPPRSTWPSPVTAPPRVVRPKKRKAPRPPKPAKRRAIAFRVGRDRMWAGVSGGLIAGGVLGPVLGNLVGSGFAVLAGLFGSVVGCGVFGWRATYDECSSCERTTSARSVACPHCDATFVGRIRRRSDHLAAEEAWERATRDRARRGEGDA